MDTQKQHGEAVRLALAELAECRPRLLQTGHEMIKAGNGAVYDVDMFTIGAVKRAVSLAKGFEVLVYAWNLMCARALLRMQIDTAIRFSALRLVDNPNSFAKEVFSGKQINKLKDRDGTRMTDARLVAHLAPVAPWLPDVYRNTSGYVHLSGSHIFAPIYHLKR